MGVWEKGFQFPSYRDFQERAITDVIIRVPGLGKDQKAHIMAVSWLDGRRGSNRKLQSDSGKV